MPLNLLAALTENNIVYDQQPTYRDFCAGDVRHSQADITKAMSKLGYDPQCRILDGIAKAMSWYVEKLGDNSGL